MKNKVFSFLEQLFSKDESYVSVLAVSTICFLILSVYMVLTSGDIPSNLYNLDIWMCAFIATQTIAEDRKIDGFDIYNKRNQ